MFNPREIRMNLTFPKKTKSAPEANETIQAEATLAPSKRNYDQVFKYVAVAASAFIVIDTFRQIKIEEAKAPHL